MPILKYEIVNPIINRKKPYVDKHKALIIPNIQCNYNYYVEVMRYNTARFTYEYFILLGVTKFDEQCRKCRVDDYGRLKLIVHKDIKDYVINETDSRGNIEFNYVESEEDYDVWQIV